MSGTAFGTKEPRKAMAVQFAGAKRQENAGLDPLLFDTMHNLGRPVREDQTRTNVSLTDKNN